MKIDDLKVATLVYTIQADNANGEILEQATEEHPRVMMFGLGHVMMAFYEGLRGLEAGDDFSFTISPENAFGQPREDKIMTAPITIFMKDGVLREDLLIVGHTLRLQDGEGHPFDGRIMEIHGDYVVLDLNHPLAGHALFVKGKVLEVREPTIEEMDQEVEYRKNHQHQHHHCHHHDGDCDHDCHSCHEEED